MTRIEIACDDVLDALEEFQREERKLTKAESKALNGCFHEISRILGSCRYHSHGEDT